MFYTWMVFRVAIEMTLSPEVEDYQTEIDGTGLGWHKQVTSMLCEDSDMPVCPQIQCKILSTL